MIYESTGPPPKKKKNFFLILVQQVDVHCGKQEYSSAWVSEMQDKAVIWDLQDLQEQPHPTGYAGPTGYTGPTGTIRSTGTTGQTEPT